VFDIDLQRCEGSLGRRRGASVDLDDLVARRNASRVGGRAFPDRDDAQTVSFRRFHAEAVPVLQPIVGRHWAFQRVRDARNGKNHDFGSAPCDDAR